MYWSSGVVVRVFGWEHCGSQFKSALLQRPPPGIPLRRPTVVDQSHVAVNLVVSCLADIAMCGL